jgi:hypothetical protein
VTQVARIDESTCKYLAGLLDACGSLSFVFSCGPGTGGRKSIGLTMRLTLPEAVNATLFLELLPCRYGIGATGPFRGRFVAWQVSRRAELEMLLPRIIKHMVVKARHWQWMLDTWRETRGGAPACLADGGQSLVRAAKESRRNVGPLKPKNHPTWAWLAGYFDGRGSLWFRGRMAVTITTHGDDATVLEFLRTAFGGDVFDHREHKGIKVWRRSLGRQQGSFALRFLPKLARHARVALHAIESAIHIHRQRLSLPGAAA